MPHTRIALGFQFDEETFQLYLTFRPESVELEELLSYFYFPFRLRVGDTELFWSPPTYDVDDTYLPALPLLATVLGLQTQTRLLDTHPAGYTALVELENYGSLTLRRLPEEPDRIRLHTSMTGQEAQIVGVVWQQAVDQLVIQSQELLLQRLPDLAKNPQIGPWLRFGVLPPDPA